MIEATNTHLEVEASGVDTAVLPVGAIEQHGPHLPLATDWAQAEAVAGGVAGRLDAFLLPGIPYGCSQAHAGFEGPFPFPRRLWAPWSKTSLAASWARAFRA